MNEFYLEVGLTTIKVTEQEWVKAHEELVAGVEALFHTDTEHFYLDQDINHSQYMFE